MTSSSQHVVVVGASLGGTRTLEELRRVGSDGRITLVVDETCLPYDRPPLSKQVLAGTKSADDVALRSPEALAALDLDLLVGRTAVRVDGASGVLDDVPSLPFSRLVVATGVSARRLPRQPAAENVHVLRTPEDSLRLRDGLRRARSLVVVGGGFIGAEVAAVARGSGLDVAMVEALPSPFARVLGAEVGARCAQLHRDMGVRLRVGVQVTEFVSDGSSVRLTLADDEVLEADLALVAVGTVVSTGWLGRSGLDVANGVACNARGRADGRDDVLAVGDCAAWKNATYGGRHRVEHWTNASEQARVAAWSVLGREPEPGHADVPYFWSDQYRTKTQLVGRPDLADRVEVSTPARGRDPMLGLYFSMPRFVAAVTFNAPVVLARMRPLVAQQAGEEDARATAASLAA